MLDSLLAFIKINLGDGAFYALFGFLFLFSGITLLVAIFSVLGVIMKKVNARKPKIKKIKSKVKDPSDSAEKSDDEVSPETIAAIMAAISAIYESENATCDFVVKRIKRL